MKQELTEKILSAIDKADDIFAAILKFGFVAFILLVIGVIAYGYIAEEEPKKHNEYDRDPNSSSYSGPHNPNPRSHLPPPPTYTPRSTGR